MGIFRKKRPSAALPTDYDAVEESDRQVLTQLVTLGAVLDEPRHVLHYLYVPERDAADASAAEVASAGWEVEVTPSASGDGTWCVLAQRHGHVLSPEAVITDRRLFDDLATQHDGEYDGWEASLR